MNQFLKGVARAISETFTLPEPILEVGSYHVPGQETLADLRSYFLAPWEFRPFLEEHPEATLKLLGTLARRLRAAQGG